jgi:hypothetical protein
MPPWGFETLCTAGATACNNPLLVFTNDENNNTNGRGTCVTHNHLLSLPPWRHTMIICHSLCLLPRDTPSPVCHWSRHCWGELGSWGEEQLIDPVPAFPPLAPLHPCPLFHLGGGWELPQNRKGAFYYWTDQTTVQTNQSKGKIRRENTSYCLGCSSLLTVYQLYRSHLCRPLFWVSID